MFISLAGPSAAELREFTARLGAAAVDPAEGLERIRAMEELRSALAAAQAVEVAALVEQRRVAAEVEIATVERPGVGSRRRFEQAARQTVADIGKARRISPWQAGRFVRWACAARAETPATFALLASGVLSERRAMTVFEIAAPLTPEQRRAVDAELAPGLPGWGDGKVDTETRAAVYRVDPAGACQRAAYAAEQRRVTTRPAPDTMAWLTLLAPVAQVVACRAALEQAATQAKSAGDPRSRGAVMADTLVERVTGQTTATAVPIAIQLVITDRTLLDSRNGGDEPARLVDGTPIPAPHARDLILDTDTTLRVRRLFTDPTGRLVSAETTSRDLTPAMGDLVRLRDRTCTTDWCDAPIRHIDHHHPHTHGGRTSLTNARGLCQWCNQTKADQIPAPTPEPPTPCAPARPSHRRRRQRSPVERRLRRTLASAPTLRPPIVVDLPHHRCTVQQCARAADLAQLSTAGSNSTHSSR